MSGASVASRQSPSGGLRSPMTLPTTQRPGTAERLTPMPDYMRPVTRSAQRKFKKLHEDHMMTKLMDKRSAKKDRNQATREEAHKIMRKIPMELLAKEWMKDTHATVETRAFLVDKILPTLILGMEKVLMEADRRDLADKDGVDSNFNPVNYLAQYLMRNNPRYSNFSEASPYIRGLRKISEELKTQLFDIEENKLARIKMEARKKRMEREKYQNAIEAEKDRREQVIRSQFHEWNVGLYPDGRVRLALLQNALRSFVEIAQQYPGVLGKVATYTGELDSTDDTNKMISLKDFITYLKKYIDNMPREVFDEFMLHMSRCANAYRSQAEREQRKVILSQLFVTCDHSGVGMLDRHRILDLFAMFYDKALEMIKDNLRNPRRWPVIDHEYEILSDDEDELSRKSLDPSKQTKESETQPDDLEPDTPVEVQDTADSDLYMGVNCPSGDVIPSDRKNVPSDGKVDSSDSELATISARTLGGDTGANMASRVSFAQGTAFLRDRTLLSQNTRSQSAASAYDEHSLSTSQFIHITETFLGDMPDMEAFQHLVRYIKDGYVETEEERLSRLMKAKKEQQAAKRKALLNSLFEMWDNDGSGFLDLDEVETVMKKYKDGMDNEHIDKARTLLFRGTQGEEAKKEIRRRTKYHDSRLSKREFRDFIYKIVELMGGAENFDFFVEFLLNSVERTYQERVRGEARKKWLHQITKAGETGGAAMHPVYRAVFQALFKDADAHGGGKQISAYIGLLERNDGDEERGDVLLRYTATTPDHAAFVLNNVLYKDMKGISFSAIESGKPIHVPRVNNHGNITFWRPGQPDEDNDGSLIVVPLKDRKKRVFGLLGIDTLMDPKPRSIFITHEIQFFQGVAKAFSIAYHHVDIRQKTMRISESAISWIHRRSHHVHDVIVYMVEPDNKGVDFVLRRMMATDHKGMASSVKNPPRLERKDNLFRDYLFKCVDNSESLTADAYGDRHLAIPLRDDQGKAIVVIDISIGKELKTLPKAESREVMKMLKLLQQAYKEISRESRDGEKTMMLAGEQEADDEARAEILFDRLMLMELRENVSKLDAKAYAELKSYKEPPTVVHQILKAVLAMFYVDNAREGEFDDWDRCKKYVGPKISSKIIELDPTSDSTDIIPIDLISGYLDEVPHGAVAHQGSLPSQYLYNWVFVCTSLIEHTRKNRGNRKDLDFDHKEKKEVAVEVKPKAIVAADAGEAKAEGEQQEKQPQEKQEKKTDEEKKD